MLVVRPIPHSPFVFCPWQDLTQSPVPAKAHSARNQTVQILCGSGGRCTTCSTYQQKPASLPRSEEHTSELQSHLNLVCRLLLEKKHIRVHQNEPLAHI